MYIKYSFHIVSSRVFKKCLAKKSNEMLNTVIDTEYTNSSNFELMYCQTCTKSKNDYTVVTDLRSAKYRVISKGILPWLSRVKKNSRLL